MPLMYDPLTVALVTDTHVRVAYDDGQLAFPSDVDHNARNRTMAAALAAMDPALIVHLGDVVHPIPTLPTHREALREAHAIYGTLGVPLLVVPGNHDVGDKRTTANAPAHVEEGRQAFREQWGPPFQSRNVGGCHFVVVDATLLDADTEEAHAQRAWLEADLAGDHDRIFVFTHYPPFLCDPDEPEHYDNVGPEGRAWFLDQVVRHGVEAVLTGHVHRFFYNRYLGVDIYTLPSAAFTRPEYAAMRPAPPPDAEQGRDDREHLGVTRLTIEAEGHLLGFVRPLARSPMPGPRRRLGTWLRHRLGRRAELPYGDLDALAHKTARDDAPLVHLLDLGLSRIRIPLADLHDPAVRDRVGWLSRQGLAITAFSPAPPSPQTRTTFDARLADLPGAAWEVVLRPADVHAMAMLLAQWTGPALTLGRIGKPFDAEAGGYHSHFPREGFDPADPALDTLVGAAREGAVAGVAFRVHEGDPVADQVAACAARAAALRVRATCHVELPLNTEAAAQIDDSRVTAMVEEAADAAESHRDAHVLLDLLVDKDRGYWCRHGLLDPSDRPREAYLALKVRTIAGS